MREEIPLDKLRSAKYEANVERLGDHSNTCFLCGKPTAEKLHVHYTTRGTLITRADDPDSQGAFPVGSECAKKLPKDFVFIY